MSEIPDGKPDPLEKARYETAVQLGYLNAGELGGVLDESRAQRDRGIDAGGRIGRRRPHSKAIWRVRVVSAVLAIVLAVLTVASIFVLSLTIGFMPEVTIVLFVLAVVATAVWIGTYGAERREILRRHAREHSEQERRAAR
ncbi:MAG: hypothetical protein ACTHON_05990 [Humibacter sp.]